MTRTTWIDPIDEWLSFLQDDSDGLVLGANVLKEAGLTLTRQTAEDNEALRIALGLDSDGEPSAKADFVPDDPWPLFKDILGWPTQYVAGAPGGPEVAPELIVSVPEQDDHLSPDWAVLDREGHPQMLVMIERERGADKRGEAEDGWAATPHQRLDRLVRETGVEIGLLLAPGILRLLFAPKGETTGWLTWPLTAMTRPAGRPMLAGLKLALDRVRFFVGPEEHRLKPLLAKSRAAQNEVSEKLAGQVLGALHDLLRGLHAADPERIEHLVWTDPRHLYEGLLSCLMRLVFLLYAEDRDLLPTARSPEAVRLWQSGYSIRTLFTRLDDDAARHFDTMEDRRGGWGQLLAVFRLIHGGHEGWIKGRGGKLFDPDVFPFLEGRDLGEEATVLPVSDACVHRVLQGLMTLPAATRDGGRERLSYRTLDVEQIGSVYETVMGFTAEAAEERMIALHDEKGLPTFVGLASLLKCKPGERTKYLKDRAIKLTARQTSALKEAASEAEAITALADGPDRAHKVGAIDKRGSPDQRALPQGAPYLQPTDERRRSGSHYTPRELTAPIVTHALEPAFDRIGPKATPDEVLKLKICDPACGSGAFLVEACRQLGARLVQAWAAHPYARPAIPEDETEDTHARRLVAQRCLYGVDKNPMAADLARLSLWLATLAAEHEFTFLDHAVKSGDSLVGLAVKQIARARWDHRPGTPLFEELIRQRVREAEQLRDNVRDAPDDMTLEERERWHAHAEDSLNQPRIYGDALIGAFFSADKAGLKEAARVEVEQILTAPGEPDYPALNGWAARSGVEPFHWELEFPEVFEDARRAGNPGFDAIVGNPPFAGKNTISAASGPLYLKWLQELHRGAHGNADLVAHFFRRAFSLLRNGGTFGLIATNTIGQGDTRATGLAAILKDGGAILRAVKRYQWPNEGAAVIVSIVHIMKGALRSPMLDGRQVPRISAYLVAGDFDDAPAQLAENGGRAFQGSILLGMGFTFDDTAAAKGEAESLATMEALIKKDLRNEERIKPYIGGEEINTSPTHVHRRYAIDFEEFPWKRDASLPTWSASPEITRSEWDRAGIVPLDYPEPVASDWADLAQIVETRVKPFRQTADKKKYERMFFQWWKYWNARPNMNAATAGLAEVLAVSRVSPQFALARIAGGAIYADSTVVFAYSNLAPFAVLQSRVHEVWTRFFSSSMKDDLRYAPSDCFETFPFPTGYETDPALEEVGRHYHDHRAELMVAAGKGMTKTYNRFHTNTERAAPIARLRELHDAMDRAVLTAYGWHDLAAPPDQGGVNSRFLTEDDEDDHTYQGRLFWPAETRDRVLARLLALNATRAASESDPVYGPEDEPDDERTAAE